MSLIPASRRPAQCCGSSQYGLDSLCCSNTIQSKAGYIQPACCGIKLIDILTYTCGPGEIPVVNDAYDYDY
jgi:hypothetical protein